MLEKLKTNIGYAICAFLGLFNFIFMAMPYLTISSSYSSYTEHGTGYEILGGWEGNFYIVLLSIISLCILIASVVMLLFGAFALLCSFVSVKQPDIVNKFITLDIAKLLIKIFMIINIVHFSFLFMIGFVTTVTAGSYGSVLPGVGAWLVVIFAVCAHIANKIISAKLNTAQKPAVKVVYACTACGATAKKGNNFCSACGGKVEKKVVTEGSSTEDALPEETVAEEATPTEASAHEATAEEAKASCPVCYSAIPEGTTVCPVCGSAVK